MAIAPLTSAGSCPQDRFIALEGGSRTLGFPLLWQENFRPVQVTLHTSQIQIGFFWSYTQLQDLGFLGGVSVLLFSFSESCPRFFPPFFDGSEAGVLGSWTSDTVILSPVLPAPSPVIGFNIIGLICGRISEEGFSASWPQPSRRYLSARVGGSTSKGHIGCSSVTEYIKNDRHYPNLHLSRDRQANICWVSVGLEGKSTNFTFCDPKIIKTSCVDEIWFNIFIKNTDGSHHCMRLNGGLLIQELKKEIQSQIGTPINQQSLIFAGRCLQDHLSLQEYSINNNSTIFLNLRLRGGCNRDSTKYSGSFRDAVKGKGIAQNKSVPETELPGPYIVEQKKETPLLKVHIPEVIELHSELSKNAVICRFNGFWPKSDALHQWIYSSWTNNCDVHLFSKGFFIVCFSTEQERDSIIQQGPWFWGNAGLFITPWFDGFDANTMKISTMPVWVRLHNLPLHFWNYKFLSAIGNSLGNFLKIDEDRVSKGIVTFARICVEVDLSQGLPDHITLVYNNTTRTQPLDYENTAFRCRICLQTGHLQYNCPLSRKYPKGKKKQQKKPRGWQQIVLLEEEEDMQSEPPENQMESEFFSGQEHNQEESTPDANLGPNISQQQHEPQLEVSGIKRTHGSEGSESEKELPLTSPKNQLAIITPTPDSGGWRRVEKKKGRKV